MYVLHRLLKIVPWLVMGGLVAMLEPRLSPGAGGLIYLGVVALATLAGAMLLRSTETGQANWRNAFATTLLPCSGILGYGSLVKLCLSNMLGSILFGLVCFVVVRYVRHHDYPPGRISGWTIGCGLAWIVLVWIVLFLLRQYGRKYYTGASGARKFSKLIAAPTIALAGSIALVSAGLPFVAFVVAMIPIVMVLVSMGPLMLIVIIAKLSGKPFRWN